MSSLFFPHIVNFNLDKTELLLYITIAMEKKPENISIKVDAKSALPVYEQIKRAIKLAILSRHLKEGDRLLTLREMASKLMVNPNTVIKVYEQLENEGFIYSRPGAGYYVRLDRSKFGRERSELFEKITRDYISRVLDLGFSSRDMLQEITRLTGLPPQGASRRARSDD
jgi:GntR family transcriptional regulator